MGKIKAHGIAFKGAETFDAGSKIIGHVFVQLEQPLKVRGIRILFTGTAEVKWTERRRRMRDPRSWVTYRSSENYLNHSILLHGNRPRQGNSTFEMPPGLHTFPFIFALPMTLPGSFEGDYGHVRYSVKSNIDLPWKFDPTSKRHFIVRPRKDLNLDPDNKFGISAENEKNLCCLCCQSGPISAAFKIQRKGFVPGEGIKIFAEMNNDSDSVIDMSYVGLKRTVYYYAEGERKTETSEIASITGPAIRPFSKATWNGQSLIVPSTPPSGFPGCHIIDVEYQLKLSVHPAGLSFALEIPFEINIGTIPLRQQHRVRPGAPQGSIEESLVNFAAQASTPPSYNSIASTNYEIATAPREENTQGDDTALLKKGGYQSLS